jgi:hypothetical protein
MIDGICSNINCTNHDVGFEIDEENQYCPKCGCRLQPVDAEKAPADLSEVLTRYAYNLDKSAVEDCYTSNCIQRRMSVL